MSGANSKRASGEAKKVKKDSALFKAKKNLAGKAATSSLGRALIDKILDKDTSLLMKSIKRIIVVFADKKKARETQNTIIKILVKAQFQIEKKTVDPKEFSKCIRPLMHSFKRLIRLGKREYSPEDQLIRFKKVEDTLKSVGGIVEQNLGPHLTPKNKTRFTDCVNYLADQKFLQQAWTDPRCKVHRDKAIGAMEKLILANRK